MTIVNKTNSFFKEKIYSNLTEFACLPFSWAFELSHGSLYPIPDFRKLFLAALFSPILVPITIATTAIALCLAGISAVFHGLSLAVAVTADALSNTDEQTIDQTMAPV